MRLLGHRHRQRDPHFLNAFFCRPPSSCLPPSLSLSLSHSHTHTPFPNFNSSVSVSPLYISLPHLPFFLFFFVFLWFPFPLFRYLYSGIPPALRGCATTFSTHSCSIRSYPKRKMNHCGIHQNNTFASSREEMRSSVSLSVSFETVEPMVCPKPRRLNLFSTTINEPVRPLRWQMCHPSEGYESKAGPELLDIIFAKGGVYGASDQTCTQVASSPPFFSGSPPSRVSNPLIQDARFGDDKFSPVSPRSMIPNPAPSGMSSSSPSSSARKGGCLRSNFGNKPAVRIEGFDCLDRDNRRNCSIPTLA